MLVLAVGSIPLLVFERSVSWVESIAGPLNWAITGVFAVELGVRMVLHGPGRSRYAVSKWYDLAIVALTVIPVLMPLRALRSVRVVKVPKILRLVALAERGWHIGPLGAGRHCCADRGGLGGGVVLRGRWRWRHRLAGRDGVVSSSHHDHRRLWGYLP